MRNRRAPIGLSLIELLVVLAMVAVLAGIGFTQLNFSGAATSQAATIVSSAVNRARIEAIRSNQLAGVEIVAANADYPSGYVRVCRNIDVTLALACPAPSDAASIRDPRITAHFTDFTAGDLGRARINDSETFFFDRRGVMSGPRLVLIGISDRAGQNERVVRIEPTGRASVQ